MSFLAHIGCSIDRHEPSQRNVVWDGRVYVGKCRHCGAEIIRVQRRKWRKRTD